MKKGALKTVLATLIDLVLVTLALLVLIGIIAGLMGLFTDKDNPTMNNFNELVTKIEDMDKGESFEMPVYVKNGKVIAGFTRENVNIGPQCGLEETLIRPAECGKYPCLCICEDECKKNYCQVFREEFDFKGNSECSAALIVGQKEIRTVHLRKRDDEFLICMSEC